MSFSNRFLKGRNQFPKGMVIAASLALTACGGGGPQIPEGPRGIFTSTGDCTDSKLFPRDTCRSAIEAAIRMHRSNAPTYKSERICKATEVHCERSYTGEFRPRLLAFIVQKSMKEGGGIEASPLYPPNGMEKGMRDLSGVFYLANDITLTYSSMSKRALLANQNTDGKRKKRGMF